MPQIILTWPPHLLLKVFQLFLPFRHLFQLHVEKKEKVFMVTLLFLKSNFDHCLQKATI